MKNKVQKESNDISTEVLNRLSVWVEALNRAYTYLQIEKNLIKFNSDSNQYLMFTIAKRPHSIHKALMTSNGLIEASIINFRQVFSTGKHGTSFSDNQDQKIQAIRSELIEHTINELGWTREEYNEIFRKIKNQRNELLAHYDGTAGEYKELEKGLSSRKMVGAHLLPSEVEKFEMILKTMYEYIFKLVYD